MKITAGNGGVYYRKGFPGQPPGKNSNRPQDPENLTQAQLAETIGPRPHHISEMEHGKRVIRKAMAKKIAEVLNTSYKMFLFHDLRRTFKTSMARTGIAKAIRGTILGQNLSGMDDHYMK